MADKIHRVLILGSGPAGLTAALYTARANLAPVLIEGAEPGGQFTITTEVENYPGFEKGIQGPEMMEIFRRQAERFGTQFIFGHATEVRLGKWPFEVVVEKEIHAGAGADHRDRRDREVARHRIREGADGIWRQRMCDLRRRIFQGQGCHRGWRRRHRDGGSDFPDPIRDQGGCHPSARGICAPRRSCRNARARIPRFKFIWNSAIDTIHGTQKDGVTGVTLKDTNNGATTDHKTDGVFIAIGHQPNSQLFKGQLDMDEVGYLKTQPGSTYTNIPGVFAAGDIADSVYRQAVTAAGTGCMAAIDAERWLEANHPD